MSESPRTPLKPALTNTMGMAVDPIYGEDESFEVETPDFHFDWLANAPGAAGSASPLEAPKPKSTPPPAKPLTSMTNLNGWDKPTYFDKGLPSHLSRDSSPAYSSTSATPPSDMLPNRALPSRTLPSTLSTSDLDDGHVPAARVHPRVVSAPLTSSTSLSDAEPSNYKTRDDVTENRTVGRTAMVTPGLNQRTLGSSVAVSSARRMAKPIASLSRFGGPARRVARPADADAAGADESPSADASMTSASPPPHRLSFDPTPEETEGMDEDTYRPRHERHDSPPSRYRHDSPERQRYQSPPPKPYSPPREPSPSRSPSPPPLVPSPPLLPRVEGRPRPLLEPSPPDRERRSRHHSPDRERPSRQQDEREREDYRPAPPLEERRNRSAGHTPPPNATVPSRRAAPNPAPIHRATRPAPSAPVPLQQHTAPPERDRVSRPEPGEDQKAPVPAPQTKRVFMVNGEGYDRLGILGRGGSSKVYSVLGHTKRVVYALKRVGLERADAETYQSYTNEIELLRRLKGHDRIIQLIDHQITFKDNGRPKLLMMVMECGEIDFAALLDEQRGKPLNMSFVGLYWQQMLEAVQAVHAENVVHTDLKPANFVLVKGRLKIIDFGIAKAIANDTVNIQRDQQIGTVNYMSPEAIQRMNNQKVLKLSYPSDVWSLGCILYQMIYGNPPFHAIPGGPLSKMNKIADPSHRIDYPSAAVFSPIPSGTDPNSSPQPTAVTIPTEAIDTMRGCLDYHKDRRLTIPQLLEHDFLSSSGPSGGPNNAPPHGATWITKDQMAVLVSFVQKSRDQRLSPNQIAEDLFDQLAQQNSTL